MPAHTHPTSFYRRIRHIPNHSIIRHPPTGAIGVLVHIPGKYPAQLERAPEPGIPINRHETVEVLMTPGCLARRWLAEHTKCQAQVGQTVTIEWNCSVTSSGRDSVTGVVEHALHPSYTVRAFDKLYHGTLVTIHD